MTNLLRSHIPKNFTNIFSRIFNAFQHIRKIQLWFNLLFRKCIGDFFCKIFIINRNLDLVPLNRLFYIFVLFKDVID